MSKLQFMFHALKDFKTTGSPMPSQRFLIKKIISQINSSRCSSVIELGAGEGCITREILKKMPKSGKILIFEINKELSRYIIKDKNEKRAIIINDYAKNLEKYSKIYKMAPVDYIISSLPLAQIKRDEVIKILNKVKNNLRNGGLFVQYQYSLKSAKIIKEVFKNKVEIKFVPLNFPPAFVYICKK